jgi:hypothetical protein
LKLLTSRALSFVVAPILLVILVACGGGGGGAGTSLPNIPAQSNGSEAAPTASRIAGTEVARTASTGTSSSGRYPIYSSYFTGNSPFHHTVAQLMSAGAKVRSSTIASNYWSQGLLDSNPDSQTGGPGPLYFVKSGDPAYRFRCPAYGTCNANGMSAHFPDGAVAQTGSDHHLSSFDPVYAHGEIDGWGGDGNGGQRCNLDGGDPGAETCSWGGYFPFSGDGLAPDGSSGNAAGYAFGISNISAQEMLDGHIDHALGIEQSCLDDDAVYPARIGRSTDSTCPSHLEPNARYGDLIHLKAGVNVSSLGYSHYCQVIVQALQTYGAYTTDNDGGYGIFFNLEAMSVYPNASNPWYTTILPSMAAGGDASSWNGSYSFSSCLNRIRADDIEVIEISSRLP